jgi:hypothetical protein
MSELNDAMKKHIAFIVLLLHRPFSFLDFMHFEVGGTEYTMKHGTFRNKVSMLKRSGDIELAYKSLIAFYTLEGHRFDKPMTPTRMRDKAYSNDPIARLIQDLPMDKNALHDIRLRFETKGIWVYLSTYHPELLVNQYSKDILLPTWNIEDLLVRAIVHRTDTVSVSVGCSLEPVAADINGVVRLSNAFTRVEERLGGLLKNAGVDKACTCTNRTSEIVADINYEKGCQQKLQVPDYRQWIVTMWHFGTDSSVEYAGDRFSVTWEKGQHALLRAYTKTMKDKKIRIRLERQEYPNKTFPEAIEEKINSGGNPLA